MARAVSAAAWGHKAAGVRRAGEGRRGRRDARGRLALRGSPGMPVVLGLRVLRALMESPERAWGCGGCEREGG